MKDGDIRINGSSTIYSDYGVAMGEDFINVLTEPLSMKEYVENESRLEHGKRVIVDDEPKIASRDLTLEFTIEGSTPADFLKKKTKFLQLMYSGSITLQVPEVGDEIYHLIYTGKSGEFGMNPQRTFCHMVLKFTEPNPNNRTL